jgi:hypothetical protein
MTSKVAAKMAKKAGSKVFERHLEAYTPQDPLYEYYTDERGKQRRRKVRCAILF